MHSFYPTTGKPVELFAVSSLLAQNALWRGTRKPIAGSHHLARQRCRLVATIITTMVSSFILVWLSKLGSLFSSNKTSTLLTTFYYWNLFFYPICPTCFIQASDCLCNSVMTHSIAFWENEIWPTINTRKHIAAIVSANNRLCFCFCYYVMLMLYQSITFTANNSYSLH